MGLCGVGQPTDLWESLFQKLPNSLSPLFSIDHQLSFLETVREFGRERV